MPHRRPQSSGATLGQLVPLTLLYLLTPPHPDGITFFFILLSARHLRCQQAINTWELCHILTPSLIPLSTQCQNNLLKGQSDLLLLSITQRPSSPVGWRPILLPSLHVSSFSMLLQAVPPLHFRKRPIIQALPKVVISLISFSPTCPTSNRQLYLKNVFLCISIPSSSILVQVPIIPHPDNSSSLLTGFLFPLYSLLIHSTYMGRQK